MIQPHMLETVDDAGFGLRVVFLRHEDRYGHRVEVLRDGRHWTWLTSEEGSPQEHWPASPPLQQLSLEDRGGSQSSVALLLGMAGRSHWSASFEPLEGRPELRVEMACRLHQPPESLGCTYAATSSTQPALEPTAAAARFDLASCTAELLGQGVDDAPPPKLIWTAGRLRVCPAWESGTRPVTVRWRYLLRLQHDALPLSRGPDA